MTDLLLFLIEWFGIGVASWYLARYWWTRDFDWTVADAIFYGFMALTGPVFFCAMIFISFVQVIPKFVDTKRVLKEKQK